MEGWWMDGCTDDGWMDGCTDASMSLDEEVYIISQHIHEEV